MKTDEFKDIIYDKDENTGIVLVTINLAKRKNAMSPYSFLEMWWAADALQKDETAKAMVITGGVDETSNQPEKEAFSSGGYFSAKQDFNAVEGGAENQPDLEDLAQKKLVMKMWELDKPVIVALNGLAVGGGFTMPLACADLIYASEYAWAQMPFVSLGIVAELASSFILPRLLGFQKAKEIIYFGKKMSATQMFDMGLVNEVLPHAELVSYSINQARKLVAPKGAGMAVRMAKQILNKPLTENISQSLDLENKALNKAFKSSDFIEALSARQERRSPIFKGK